MTPVDTSATSSGTLFGATKDSCEIAFRNGLAALEHRRYREAMSLFQAAMEQESEENKGRKRWMKYASYLGLALTLHAPATLHLHPSVGACETCGRIAIARTGTGGT